MMPFPSNIGVSSLNLHEYGMAYVRSLHPFSSLHTIPCSLIFCRTSIGIMSDHTSYSTSSYSCFLISSTDIGDTSPSVFARTVVALSVSFIQHV